MPSLTSLIEEVEQSAPSAEPLAQLETASASVRNLDDLTDSMLSHFVDKCRRSGHSWAEIGSALGVTKQAVQKRFTPSVDMPGGFERFTPRARRVIEVHAPAASATFGHRWIGTEHLLLGLYGDPEALAPVILTGMGLDREKVVAAIGARFEQGSAEQRSWTPRAWAALQACTREALMLGHNYIGTEHQLLALLSGVGGVGADILAGANVTRDRVTAKVIEILAGYVQKRPS